MPWQGYARLNNAEAALDVLREFWQQGGEPDDSMFEVLVNLCVRTGEFRKALQVSQHIAVAGKYSRAQYMMLSLGSLACPHPPLDSARFSNGKCMLTTVR